MAKLECRRSPYRTPIRSMNGFTLIELMIVVIVIGILAAIAMTSYESSVIRTRRGAAKGCLLDSAQAMERYYTVNTAKPLSYEDGPAPTCSVDVTKFYTVSFDGTPDATSFKVQAVAKGRQATKDAACATLSIDHTGKQLPAAGDCW